MDLNDPRVKKKMEMVEPILIGEYSRWLDSERKIMAQDIMNLLSISLKKYGILVNSLCTSPKFELFFSFWVNDFDSGSYGIALSGNLDFLTISKSVTRGY